MTKEEAAVALGVSVRALERYTQQNRISVRYEKGKTKPTPVYEEADVEAFKQAFFQPTFRPTPVREDQAVAVIPAEQPKAVALREEFLVKLAEAFDVPIAEKPVLKLAEVRKLTGIPIDRLKQAIEAGRLKAVKDSEWGRGYRLRRADLDAYIAKGPGK
jgi:excisionase family DNA binding protein